MPELELRQATRAYSDTEGLFDLNLQVNKGEALGILGPTGSGKSTAIRLLAGLIRPDRGEALLCGKPAFSHRHEDMGNVGLVLSDASLPPNMSGDAFIRLISKARGNVGRNRTRELFEQLDLNPLGSWSRMEAAQRRKISLVLALMHSPDILLLDEPVQGMQPADRAAALDLIRQERDKGKAVLMTSHVLEEVQRCCSRVIILREGRAVTHQTAQALQHTRQKVYHITFADLNQAAAFAQEWETGVELLRNRVVVAIPASPQVLLKTLTKYDVTDLVGGRESEEDNILRAWGGDML